MCVCVRIIDHTHTHTYRLEQLEEVEADLHVREHRVENLEVCVVHVLEDQCRRL